MDREIFNFIVMSPDIEGGARISRDPLDPGGTTRYGLSQKNNPDLDVECLDEDTACDAYHVRYWLPAGCHWLDKPLALLVFDMAINQGPSFAVRTLQSCVGVTVDGKVGPITAEAARNADFPSLLIRIYDRRVSRYLNLDNAVEEHNERGWMNRKTRVIVKAMEMYYR